MDKARQAAEQFSKFDRQKTDSILKAVYEAAFNNRFQAGSNGA
jgi:hypothetical protein